MQLTAQTAKLFHKTKNEVYFNIFSLIRLFSSHNNKWNWNL